MFLQKRDATVKHRKQSSAYNDNNLELHRDITRTDLRQMSRSPSIYIQEEDIVTAELPKMRETIFREQSQSRKYIELEKYFPIGSKGAIVKHQKLYAQPIKKMELLQTLSEIGRD